MIALDITLSYLVNLGIIVNTHKTASDVRAESIAIFILSPITLPIIVGMMISDK